eukprot:gene29062-35076_t
MARIFFVAILALVIGTLQALTTSLQESIQAAHKDKMSKLKSPFGVKPSELTVVPQEGRRLQAANGWLYATTYTGDQCHGVKRAELLVGFATDVCLASKKVSGMPARSFIFSCSSGEWRMATYNNYNCKGSGYIGTDVMQVPVDNGECAAYPPPGSDDDEEIPETQARYYCEAAGEANLMANYVLNKYYDSDSCTKLGAIDGFRNGGCFPFEMGGEKKSVLTQYPLQLYYMGGSCRGTPLFAAPMDALEPTCSDLPTDDDEEPAYDDIRWSKYTSEITCTVPDNSECSDPGTNEDNTVLKTGQVAGLVFGTIGGAAFVLIIVYYIFASKSAGAGAAAAAAGATEAAPGKV